MTLIRNLLGTNAAGDAPNVEKVFSTYLINDSKNSSSPVTVNNGIDLSGEGGMVWVKSRTSIQAHSLTDTERGTSSRLSSDNTNAEYTGGWDKVDQFNSDGFRYTNGYGVAQDYASWTFRKAPRFFDVVTYTGNRTESSSYQDISHNLGVEPGLIIVKSTSGGGDWMVYHKDVNVDGTVLKLNTSDAASDFGNVIFDVSEINSTSFRVGNMNSNNANGVSYVAYVFAHDPVGEDNDGMIACGSYVGQTPTTYPEIDLGWEPQWILVKNTTSAADWAIFDTMRGIVTSGVESDLRVNTSAAELTNTDYYSITPTGFLNTGGSALTNDAGSKTYIYMAIRAPMMVEPKAGSEVFAIDTRGSTGDGKVPAYRSTFPVDLSLYNKDTDGSITSVSARLIGTSQLYAESTNSEAVEGSVGFDHMNGMLDYTSTDATKIAWMFKRAKGFFDVVAYTGNGPSNHDVNHSLGVVPEMIIVKRRDAINHWICYHSELGATKYLHLSLTSSQATNDFAWGDTEPSATTFRVDNGVNASGSVNANNSTYIAYLFATLAGVSKVGSYTGNGSSQNIDCGFSTGARFVLIKRTDSSGDWYIWDTERGIVTGNDPHLSLNTQAAQVTSDDSIDPESSGFTVNQVAATNINVTSATYIFLAIA